MRRHLRSAKPHSALRCCVLSSPPRPPAPPPHPSSPSSQGEVLSNEKELKDESVRLQVFPFFTKSSGPAAGVEAQVSPADLTAGHRGYFNIDRASVPDVKEFWKAASAFPAELHDGVSVQVKVGLRVDSVE